MSLFTLYWLAVTTGEAAFTGLPSPTPEAPGVAVGVKQPTGGGTVLAIMDSDFVDNALPAPFASGTLRTLVVDRSGGLLDFYYQLINRVDGNGDIFDEFFRMKTTGGFPTLTVLSVGQTDSLAGLIAGVGSGFDPANYVTGFSLKPAATADRDVATIGSVGFDFSTTKPAFIGDPGNIGDLERSMFLVVRTDSSGFGLVPMVISGAATSFATSFASLPEPSSVLAGLAIIGAALIHRCYRLQKLPRSVESKFR